MIEFLEPIGLRQGCLVVVALCCLFGVHVYGQLERGLSLYPGIDVGTRGYITSRQLHARPIALDGQFNSDVEFRTNSKTAFNIGLGVGLRAYAEEYDFLGVKTRLEHRVVEPLFRLYLTRTLHDDAMNHWLLCYGLTFASRGNSTVLVRDAAGNSGRFRANEAVGVGLRVGLLRGQRSWLSGLLQVGVVMDLHFAASKEELYTPWLGRYSLEIGRSRCFVGCVLRYRLARVPLSQVHE